MSIVAVSSPKGGAGKSTLATNIAAYWANRGHDVLLGDIDPQQSSALWLGMRPHTASAIDLWKVSPDFIVSPPRDASHVVLDTPAGLEGLNLREVMRIADSVLIPLQPSVFDIHATRDFVNGLLEMRGRRSLRVGLVANRVNERSLAAGQLQQFVEALDVEVVSTLRSTQNYVRQAAAGLGIFDAAPSRVRRDLEQWQPLCDWLDSV